MLKFTPSPDRLLRRLLIVLLLLAPMGILLPYLDAFPFQTGAAYSDFALSHYPNTLFLANSIQQTGELPLWSNQILGGYPFAADPLSSVWYPLSWLALLFSLPSGINLVLIGHLWLGGAGMFLFLRSEGRSGGAALVGAYLFELSPKLTAHYAAGHVTLIYAVCWTPWLLLAGKRDLKDGWWFGSGLVLGLMTLADIRWTPIAGCLWFGYMLAMVIHRGQVNRTWMLKLGANLLVGFCVAAPLILPLFEYTNLSTRFLLTPADNLAFSLPVERLAGLFVPDPHGYAEWIFFPGLISLIPVLWAFSIRKFWKDNYFWMGGLILTVLFALGSNFPLAEAVMKLPGLSLLRVPSRVLFLVTLFFGIFLAWTIDYFSGLTSDTPVLPTAGSGNRAKQKRPGNMLLPFGFVIFVSLICAGLLSLTGSIPLSFGWTLCFALAGLGLVFLCVYQKIKTAVFLAFAGLVVLESGLLANQTIDFRPAGDILSSQSQASAWILAQDGGEPFRIYSPSYSMPQQVAALNHFELADGVDPLQIAGYAAFMEKASGVPSLGYSVTLPPFRTARPELDNSGRVPDPQALGLLNVRYILAQFDLSQAGLAPAARFGETRIYENQNVRPRAWVEGPPDTISFRPANLKYYSPNRIVVEGRGPGRLVLAENFYPGWKANIDGKPGELSPAYSILRSVTLEDGEHEVEFIYQPAAAAIGLGLALAAWVSILLIGVAGKRWK